MPRRRAERDSSGVVAPSAVSAARFADRERGDAIHAARFREHFQREKGFRFASSACGRLRSCTGEPGLRRSLLHHEQARKAGTQASHGLARFLPGAERPGLHNLAAFLPVVDTEPLFSFAQAGMWLFYLPSQVLITLSVRKK